MNRRNDMTAQMETTFTFRNMESTDALRDHALDKLDRLDKYLIRPAQTHIIFKLDGSRHVAEITVNFKGKRFISSAETNDMYMSVDNAVNKMEIQLSRTKERIKGHKGE